MKIIVGLGNPGKEYCNTRHNIGFMCIDNYARKNNCKINKTKFKGKYTKIQVSGEDVILLKPQSYINLSGDVIKKYLDYFKIPVGNLLIINDDLDLEVGKIKLKPSGGSGGHNGLKNIEANLNTQEYKRLKIGIANDKNMDTRDYVLGKIEKSNQDIYNDIFSYTNNILEDFVKLDFDSLMAKYNHK